MTYPTHRTRFVSARIVRFTVLAAALAGATALAVLAPQPVIAATVAKGGADEYQVRAQAHPLGDGTTAIDLIVVDATGRSVASGRVSTDGGPAHVSSTSEGRVFDIDVTPDGAGWSVALKVSRDDQLLARSSERIDAGRAAFAAKRREPVTVNLRDADLRNVMETFSQLTGMPYVADVPLEGHVTIQVVDVPWDEALLSALKPLGLSAIVEGGQIHVVRQGTTGSTSDHAMKMDKAIKPPQLLSRVEPIYTAEAKAQRIAGVAIIEARIDETGVVRSTRILKSLPYGLGEAAADAVRQWVFTPGQIDGKPVPVVYNVTVNFRPDDAAK